ncbi:putative Fe/Zn uptake regulation protein [Streptococcus massiliensis]|uniref:Putative Fe/Zn uptake regulation protein n=2 Tax=Streptococcus massiliensis TaxID=313439 RepID=A0A380L166_9STRE|nr:putative Fe/Zn uptake regulation protein [Streptococcus massiliensis]
MMGIVLTKRGEKELTRILDIFRKKGIRLTDTRRAVTAYMIASKSHPSAEKIYQDLKPDFPKMSLATVYNNLKFLVDEGFVTELKISKDPTSYFDYMGHQHLNVICEICGKIADMDIDIPDLKREAEECTGYRIRKTQMMAYGICPECLKSGHF